MEDFEVGHFGLVTGFDEGFEARLDEVGDATAEDGLFAEEVGFGFFLEGCFKDAAAGAADAFGPGECGFFGLLAGVLVNGDEAGNAFALGVLAADDVAGAFGGHHDDINLGGRHDGLVENGESVAEEEGLAFGQIGSDVFFIDFGREEIGDGDEDDVGGFDGLGGVEDFESEFLGNVAAFAFRVEADDDVDAAFLEIEGMGMALGTEADDGAGFSGELFEIGVFVGVDFSWHRVCVWEKGFGF